ncbi:alpha/beta-hydrolase [Coprinopsis marcescibilis]|uniref:Carboxypeptidase n=1 Tax=Coprinopsis marcescibilis TaxID=230819 RepID=A0A5C3LBE9_COPMA|nr:alpha/beta-hydrolase [Coprinopsis marcescibilis]
MTYGFLTLTFALFCAPFVASQEQQGTPPSTWPHNYPGKPSGNPSTAWQNYFRVTSPLPGVDFPISQSYAGNLPVQRAGHPNDTFFFWGFESEQGSLTATPNRHTTEKPWTIWLNGGPGTSSMYGLFFENGPIRIESDGSVTRNQHSWDKLSDIFWIDQPVGVGFSTADSQGYVADQDQVGRDFIGFLDNLVKVFPNLKTRPLHISGESYAGYYIPYIMKAYFSTPNPPVKVAKVFIGDGTIAPGVAFNLVPTLSVVETFPQLIGYDPEVYLYFKEQHELCGYNLSLTYPQTTQLPDIPLVQPRDREIPWAAAMKYTSHAQFLASLKRRATDAEDNTLSKRDREMSRELWKRDISDRLEGVIDPWYGCFLLDMAIDYALNFTYPWNDDGGFNIYDVSDSTNPNPAHEAAPFLNNPQVRAALHAPTSKDWALQFPFVFGEQGREEPSPPPITFLTELATNATAKDIKFVLIAGNNDALIPHLGTELAIQNTTFGGTRGFTRKPATPWSDDQGRFGGIVHQERGWTYALFYGAGHMIPSAVPRTAYYFFKEFVLGNNPTGKVVPAPGGGSYVVGGTRSDLEGKNLPAGPEIYLGEGATQSTYVFPQATRSAWQAFIQTETATTAPAAAPTTRTRRHRALRTETESSS